jgi:DNA-binding Lrp family transcriptional regulator
MVRMDWLSKLNGVVSVRNATARYDLSVKLFVRSQKELSEFLVNEISKVRGIRVMETFVYLDGINKWVALR